MMPHKHNSVNQRGRKRRRARSDQATPASGGRPDDQRSTAGKSTNGSQGAEPNGTDAGQSAREDIDRRRTQGNGGGQRLYSDDDGRIVWLRPTPVGKGELEIVEIELANFKARIVTDILRDDGVEIVRYYQVGATLGHRPFRFEVPAARFASMAWVQEHLGAGAVITPGQGMQARLHHAILILSAEMFDERTIYAHTGWRNIDGANYFLHAGGALGALGHRTDIDVNLPEQLAHYELLEPEDDAHLKRAVRESLLLELLAPMRVMAPLLGGVYRAPLIGSDITVALYGQTGRGKTELAAIAQQHFGAGMDARRLPLARESTANVLEMVLSTGKDVLVTIDEYVPGESYGARSHMQAKAERVIRAQGNATGRGRMRADTTLRRVRPPRGQLLSTGEEVATGQSLRARMMIVELRQGDVDWAQMSRVQALAANGTYATAMGGFVVWLASQLDEAREQFQVKRLAIREEVQPEHKRTADVVAQLGAAWEIYIVFALAIGAIGENAVDELWQRIWAGLMEIAAEQSELQQAAEPTARFRDLIKGALGTGKAHVVSAETGNRPDDDRLERWGWHSVGESDWAQRGECNWAQRGECIGWLTADGALYLEPDVAYAVASKIGAIGVSAETLSARLADKGVTLVEGDGRSKRRRNRVRRIVVGQRRRVLHIRTVEWLYPTGSGPIGPSGPDIEKTQDFHGATDGHLH